VRFLRQERDKPFALFFAHKAVHPDAYQAADGTIDFSNGGYRPAPRHADLYKGEHFPRRPNAHAAVEVVKQKPAWTEAHRAALNAASRKLLDGIQAGTDEEIRLRAAMMASVDEGMGEIFKALEEPVSSTTPSSCSLATTAISSASTGSARAALRLRGGHPLAVPDPLSAWFKPGTVNDDLVLALDIAPTVLDLAGAKAADCDTSRACRCRPLSKTAAGAAGAVRSCASTSARTPCRG
jgi:arylsulfatase A-like enzyme